MSASAIEPNTRTVVEDIKVALKAGSRPFGGVLVLTGLVHVIVPGVLLRVAGFGYEQILDVRFRPRDNATGRVRAIGFGMLAAGMHLLYHGGILPDGNE